MKYMKIFNICYNLIKIIVFLYKYITYIDITIFIIYFFKINDIIFRIKIIIFKFLIFILIYSYVCKL